jgi:hypothetical protein
VETEASSLSTPSAIPAAAAPNFKLLSSPPARRAATSSMAVLKSAAAAAAERSGTVATAWSAWGRVSDTGMIIVRCCLRQRAAPRAVSRCGVRARDSATSLTHLGSLRLLGAQRIPQLPLSVPPGRHHHPHWAPSAPMALAQAQRRGHRELRTTRRVARHQRQQLHQVAVVAVAAAAAAAPRQPMWRNRARARGAMRSRRAR